MAAFEEGRVCLHFRSGHGNIDVVKTYIFLQQECPAPRASGGGIQAAGLFDFWRIDQAILYLFVIF
jgi:hypothetical protein